MLNTERHSAPRKTRKGRPAKAAQELVTKSQVRAMIASATLSDRPMKYSVAIPYSQSVDAFNGAAVQFLAQIPQWEGTGSCPPDHRLNEAVLLKKLHVRYQVFTPGGVSADASNAVRVLILSWAPQSDGYVPTIADVLDLGVYGSSNTQQAPLTPYAWATWRQQKFFRILHDETHIISSGGPAAKFVNKEFLINKTTSYSDITGTEETCQGPTFYMMTISDSTSVPHPVLSFVHRMEFEDSGSV